MKILVLNSGSSSLKYQLIDSDTDEVLAKGLAERIGLADGLIKHQSACGKKEVSVDMPDHDSAIKLVFGLLTDSECGAVSDVSEITAVGHRVVHGGEQFSKSVRVDERVLREVDKVSELAPLHNPPNLMGIRACLRLMPGTPQIAVFDTAFHQTMPKYAYVYALPYDLYSEHGIRRYGFHGTSHRYVSGRTTKFMEKLGYDAATLKVITCHLGNGGSMAAIVGGKVVDTTMGLTPAEGLVMGTRSGDLDPAILLYLQKQFGKSPEDVDNLINKKSGLLGITGKSSDMRDVEQLASEGDERAKLALEIFCYRVRKYIGAYAAAMGGLDCVVFTGGIGENSPVVRQMSCRGLGFLGVEMDPEKNEASARNEREINSATSKVKVLVIPTNEELMIARETAQIVEGSESTTAGR